ncbi:MAG: T9SS type A sorting domain-containing protein [Candidatus Latescibacteria bacterium]|nr:T9SS type A sorting domain-containing protein [Candidatus Latescibacterota bacterium]
MHWRASIPVGGTPGRANSVLAPPTSVASETDEGTPRSFSLFQNYPNPFNSETHIAFHLPRTEHLSLKIFNLTGQLVTTLMEGVYRAGRHRIPWDGRDDRGESAGSGIFFYRLTTETLQSTRTMVLVK